MAAEQKNNTKIYLNSYLDVLTSLTPISGWRDVKEMEVDKLSKEQIERLHKTACLEVTFSTMHDSSADPEFNFQSMEQILKNIFCHNADLWNLICLEYSVNQKNRIRSYKGLLKREINLGKNYVEIEVEKSESQSYLMGAICIEREIANKINLINIPCMGFYISPSAECKKITPLLKEIDADFLIHDFSSTRIDYLPLIASMCSKGYTVMRHSGNGWEEISLQLFTNLSNLTYVQGMLSDIVTRRLSENN